MEEKDLSKVLEECKGYAKRGYSIATEQEKNLRTTLSSAQSQINRAIIEYNTSKAYSSDAKKLLTTQLREINESFDELSFAFKEDLQNLNTNMSKFSVTLFGRTMSGKSTLMEILTEGDGSSIGKGAQRTTKDIRNFMWNGLEITDVPGIGAFEGEDDDQIALEAAKRGDLILFLLSDDAPQPVEADFFSKIIAMGKPVICIINIKVAISDDSDLKIAVRKINKRFDINRLDKIKNQFLVFAEQYGQDWSYIPFIYAHLKSGYLSQHTDDVEKRKRLYDISHVAYLKKSIIEQIERKGNFYRIKNFIDIISNPILITEERLLLQSQTNIRQGRIISEKKQQIDKWKEMFHRDGKSRIESLIIQMKSNLNGEIADFAENHFDDENASEAWEAILQSKGIECSCQELVDDLNNKCTKQIQEISRELESEIKFTTSITIDNSLGMHRIDDTKKKWKWAFIIADGGLAIAAGVAKLVNSNLANPLGYALLGFNAVGAVGNVFLKSREDKEQEARIHLEKKLRENVSKICNQLEKSLNNKLELLITGRIGTLSSEMNSMINLFSRLADTQRELAWRLNDHLLELNRQIVTEAININGDQGLEYHIKSVARIPGSISALLVNEGTVIPKEQMSKLYGLMEEQIRTVTDSEIKNVLISRILGHEIDIQNIDIEEEIGIAYVPIENETSDIINRFLLAQQFSELFILTE